MNIIIILIHNNKIMDFKMRDLNQQIIKFNYEQNFKNDDFFVSKSNKHIFNLIK